MRLMEILQVIMADPNVPPQTKQRVKFDALLEEIVRNIAIIDSTKIFIQDNNITKLKEDFETIALGGDPQPEVKDEMQRLATMKSTMKKLEETKDQQTKAGLVKYLLKLNDPNFIKSVQAAGQRNREITEGGAEATTATQNQIPPPAAPGAGPPEGGVQPV